MGRYAPRVVIGSSSSSTTRISLCSQVVSTDVKVWGEGKKKLDIHKVELGEASLA